MKRLKSKLGVIVLSAFLLFSTSCAALLQITLDALEEASKTEQNDGSKKETTDQKGKRKASDDDSSTTTKKKGKRKAGD